MIITKKSAAKVYRIHCQDCGTDLIAGANEIKIDSSIGFSVPNVKFICPVCGRMRYSKKETIRVTQIPTESWKDIEEEP